MNRLEAMELFLRVAETGSFTEAARQLGLPKASATTRVQALEARLGVKLLHRTTRRVSLTPEGAHYLEECGRLLRELEELEGSLGQDRASAKGRLRVDVPTSMGRHVLAPRLGDFIERYPGITLELGCTDRVVDLVAEGIDCVIRGGEVHDPSLVARKMGETPVITCAAPGYLRRHGPPRSPEELEGHVFVNFISRRTGKAFEVDFQRGDQTFVLHLPHRVATNDAGISLALAVAGQGLLQVPASAPVRQLLADGQLQRVLPDWSAPPLPFFVMYAPTRRLPTRVRVFVDWIVEVFREEFAEAHAFVATSPATP
ncbi:LysR family transcriptional regulator [Melittangium boletus]|uniref:Transcriptional regulator n=1 Tax=Melittangium boletus DSM 14713 TaxID=1294270 RepID=A0A250IHG5_9BACT|nr:LysR family transcriptional regulator [Melittangium boletus]ATB30611.1 transcriptional regulator [Melittangium boletus DSM 14713]